MTIKQSRLLKSESSQIDSINLPPGGVREKIPSRWEFLQSLLKHSAITGEFQGETAPAEKDGRDVAPAKSGEDFGEDFFVLL